MSYQIIKILTLIFFLCSCSQKLPISTYRNEIINSHAEATYEKKGWFATASGGGGPTDVIRITIHFTVYEEIDISTARIYFFENTDELLAKLNSHLEIRPYLRDFPSTYANTNIVISFHDKETMKPFKDGRLSCVCKVSDELCYLAYDQQGQEKIIFEEKLDDAHRLYLQD